MQPVFFSRPIGPAITLRSAPRLSSWNRAGDSGEARLTRALSYSQAATDAELKAVGAPVALRFDVGLPRTSRLLDERDLDNYLLPLTAELARRTEHPIVSVWGCKRYAEETTLRIEAAQPHDQGSSDTISFSVSAAGSRDDFKADFRHQIRAELATRDVLKDGPVILELAYVVGPERDWLDLWWSTVDGLSPILGQSPAEPEWHPRDGRVVDLGLHRTVDPNLGDEVRISIRTRSGWLDPVPSDSGQLAVS
jgi:hypothetical protein